MRISRTICIRILLVLVFTSGALLSSGQVFMNKDSLLRMLPNAKEDTAAVHLLINIGQQYESNEPDIAKNYYRRAGELSKKINYPLGVIKFIANYTYVLNYQGLFDSSLYYNLQSVDLSRKIGDSVYLAKTLFNTGTSYRVLGKPDKALEYYLEGQRIFKNIDQPETEAVVHDLLNVLYCDLHDYEKALSHGKAAVRLSRSVGIDDGRLGVQLTNVGITFGFMGNYKNAEPCFRETLEIAKKVGDLNMEATALVNLGDVYLHTGQHEKMKNVYETALALNRRIGSNEGISVSLRGLSMYYQFKKDFVKAEQFAQEGYDVAAANQLQTERMKMLGQLSVIHFAMGDIAKAYSYSWQEQRLSDTILNESMREKIAQMEKTFEVEQKNNRIALLEKEKALQALSIKQKTNVNRMLIGGVALLVIIGLLARRNYTHKQKLQQQRITELETEKRLAATEAVLQGQEQERYRLAKDLHDGLGGMLSGIRFTFSNMKENLVLTPENQLNFERALDMLNSSIQEMRRVAHNLMPESLLKFGLDTALNDYCQKMNQAGMIRVNYQSLGMDAVTLDQQTSIVLYRVIQGLLNNIVKHAEAKEAIVQMSMNGGKLNVTVEDDGKGFDVSILDHSKGIGWSNIKSRVELLNGRVDLHSEPGKGTSVYIELPVQ